MTNIVRVAGAPAPILATYSIAPTNPQARLFTDEARTVLAAGPIVLLPTSNPFAFTLNIPVALAAGAYFLQFTADGQPADADDTLTLLQPGVAVDGELLASLDDFSARIGTFPANPSPTQSDRAVSLLRRASAKVRSYGDATWTSYTVPALAREITLDVAERTWNNPRSDLASQSTGSVSESYVSNSAALTPDEISDLRRLGGRRSMVSVRLQPELRASVTTRRRWGWDQTLDEPC